MKKYYDIWRNNWNIFEALLSYKNEKTTTLDNFKYIETVEAESPKKAIENFYNSSKETLVLNGSWLNIKKYSREKAILSWAKELKKEYQGCTSKTAILLAKLLFDKTNNLKDSDKVYIRKGDLEKLDISWLTQREYNLSDEGKFNSCIYQNYIEEPWTPGTPCMFGEDIATDEFEEKTTNIIIKMLELVDEKNKKTMLLLAEQLINESLNKKIIPDDIMEQMEISLEKFKNLKSHSK